VEDREWDEGGRNYREHLERTRAEGFNPLKFGCHGEDLIYNLTPPYTWCGENFRVSVVNRDASTSTTVDMSCAL